jgi:hypothetical protein
MFFVFFLAVPFKGQEKRAKEALLRQRCRLLKIAVELDSSSQLLLLLRRTRAAFKDALFDSHPEI